MTDEDDKFKLNNEFHQDTGLPKISEEDVEAASSKTKVFMSIFTIVFYGIGFGIACAIHFCGSTDVYNLRITSLKTVDMQYVYLSAFLYGLLTTFLNMYPMLFKSRIMRGTDKNFRANMFIYKLAAPGASSSVVVLEEEGDVGKYNRANRSLMHFIENGSPIVLAIPLNCFVYAFPTFIVFCIYFVGRIVYTIGYTNGGYGKHAPGFML